MPKVELTPVAFARTGIDIAGTAANAPGSGGNYFKNTGKEVLFTKNGSGSPITLTIVTSAKLGSTGLDVDDRTVTINAGVTKAVGPFPKALYNDTDGNVNFSVSLETSVTHKVLKEV